MKSTVAAIAFVALLGSACSSTPAGKAANPTPSPSSSGTSTALPTVPPSTSGLAGMKSGTATLRITGKESFSIDLPLATADSQLNKPPAGFALIFKDDNNNLISMGGAAFDGTKKTSSSLALGLVLAREEGVIAHTDTKGGCSITMKLAGDTVSGTFTCNNIDSGKYAARGTFTATK